MKLTLGFSPCPNDTFIFDALVNHKVDTEGLNFEVLLEDVQTLNRWAIEGKLDLTKVSYGALPLMLEHYMVLQSGGALGKGVGPLLISAQPAEPGKDHPNIDDYTIAIPGENTTAHLLFSLAFPKAKKKIFKVFNEIEDFLLNSPPSAGKTAGVIIHENRFTYQKKGLIRLMDLGEYWEHQTGYPIPLGGIVVRRNFSPALQAKINILIRKSVEYAFGNYPMLPPYVIQHAQEMEESVMRQHIDLYVNDYSLDLGANGRMAVQRFIEIYEQGKHVSTGVNDIFIKT
jgi:1,4-dihydroxy-6-naphthoate synthase